MTSRPVGQEGHCFLVVTAHTIFKVFGLTRLRIEPSLPTSKANALTTRPWRWLRGTIMVDKRCGKLQNKVPNHKNVVTRKVM